MSARTYDYAITVVRSLPVAEQRRLVRELSRQLWTETALRTAIGSSDDPMSELDELIADAAAQGPLRSDSADVLTTERR